jgi:protocatechuate 4,5-dioxygenase beta chain
MASIIGGLATSHVPAIGGAIHKGKQQDPYWKPFFDGFPPVQRWLGEVKPDVVVVFYNDHGLNFFLDKMPTFAVGAPRPSYRNADEGWGIPTTAPLAGNLDLSWHLVSRWWPTSSTSSPARRCWSTMPARCRSGCSGRRTRHRRCRSCRSPSTPCCFRLPTARRVYKLGLSVGRAITRWADPRRVLVMGTGGLSHQLEGERAGFINKRFDLAFLDSMERNPEWATQFSDRELVAQAGTQGVELLNWLAMRGALSAAGSSVTTVHRNYHIPISNTAAGLLALQVA